MAARSLAIFLISLYCLCLSADGRVVSLSADEDTFQPLCSRMCHSSEGSNDSLIPPFQCSCSESCAVFGDCCYDSPYKDTSRPLQLGFVCLHVECKGEYQAVLSCPPHNHSDSCREQFGYMPPVTSRITNVTYGNAFCATCNEDDEDLVKWNVQLRCSSVDDLLDFRRNVNDIHNPWPRDSLRRNWSSCKFHAYEEDFSILDGLELRRCIKPEMVTMCSMMWRDPDTDQKCRSYEDPVYVGDTLYRNSHCAECNYNDLSYVECSPRFMRKILEQGIVDESYTRANISTPQYNDGSDMGMPRILHLIFDPNSNTLKSKKGCTPPKGERCCKGERFDEWTGGCRKSRKASDRRNLK